LTAEQVATFVKAILESDCNVFLSAVNEQIECAIGGKPVNFAYDQKTNSQDLDPVQRITWSITGWRAPAYLDAYEAGKCATYAGKVGFYPIDRMTGHIIKTREALDIAEASLGLRGRRVDSRRRRTELRKGQKIRRYCSNPEAV
jgi:hypothetical protein